ncbi:DNA repair protein MmcB-related protein [Siculibacillus lacustris]|uniref:DNA repair protein MmcB-related protein n=1 Tax=Siculibacillus lacustris TaxID=1549641 RepID=A0A4Q9VZI6_9HYPH|nr:MmcB family DNA repair protein [Siculibacillus lacustris]TBW41248.1 DNA repair protein MmcB-related protein [Siculibacillus lacustris]
MSADETFPQAAELDPETATSLTAPPPTRPEETRAVARGVKRHLVQLGFAVVEELPLASGRRADVVGLAANGEIWIVEVKSSVEDFRVDHKWPFYRTHCDRLLFATSPRVPLDIFPEDCGLILADAHGGEVIRPAPEHRLSAPTRRAMTLRFARAAALRLYGFTDPRSGGNVEIG